MRLNKYNKKRNFNNTKEPYGRVKKSNKKLKFVVQHHIARKDHYDLRLEHNGVYVSFAIPKGPSFNPKIKRLAIKVEDHPLDYGNFEGTIPKGEYGAGVVMLWDKGYYNVDKSSNFEKGPIKFTLNGKKLKGKWALIPFKNENWLLIKDKDEYINKFNITEFNTSIKTGKTMEEIANKLGKTNIKLTSEDKIIFDKGKITKKEIFNYYKNIGKRMMPFLEDRLISVVRKPTDEKFFMKHLDNDSKDLGVKNIKHKDGTVDKYYYIKNINGILSEVQMNSYEFHIWGSKKNNINKPDILMFDFDPDENLSIKKVRAAVKDLKSILDEFNLKSFLKTSGGKGYHVFVPLNTTWKKIEEIGKNISLLMVERWPNLYTTNLRKENRKGKIFIDYFRNKKGATSVAPYSLRLKDKPTLSWPISYKDLDKIKPDGITIQNYKKMLKRKNPWANFFIENKA